MKHSIKKRFTGEVIHECEVLENIDPLFHTRYVLTDAVKSRANLSEANLSRANLSRANLSRANLSRANLSEADLSEAKLNDSTLIGSRPFLQMGPIGSRNDCLLSFITDQGVYVRAGCFFDTLDKFIEQVNENHGDSVHGKEYRAAVEMIKTHAELWTPENSGESAAWPS